MFTFLSSLNSPAIDTYSPPSNVTICTTQNEFALQELLSKFVQHNLLHIATEKETPLPATTGISVMIVNDVK